MADISELILQVKNADNAVQQIDKVDKKLKQTAESSKQLSTLGKTLFAGWTFTKLIQGAKQLSDAWQENLITFKNFDEVFGRFSSSAEESVNKLVRGFSMTNTQAKKVLATIGSKLDLDLTPDEIQKISLEFAKLSQEIAAAYQLDPNQVSQKLTHGLYGMTKGLKDFGISIDMNSARFKQLVADIMESTGKTEKAAQALALYNQIMKKGSKFQGSFEVQAKTLSQAFKNISDKLTSGVFAKAGEVLSKIFVPILNKIDAVLSNPWVEDIMGIVVALGLVLASIKAIKVAIGGLKAGILAVAAGGGLDGVVATALVSLGGLIKGLFTALTGIITTALVGLVTFVAGLPTAVVAAIIGVLSVASLLLINKLTTGDWFDIYGMILAVINWFTTLSEKIVNWLKGKGFRSDYEIDSNFYESAKKSIKSAQDIVEDANKSLFAFLESIKSTTPQEQAEKAKTRLELVRKKFNEIQAEIAKFSEAFKLEKNYERKANYAEHIKELAQQYQLAEREFEEAYTANEEAKKAVEAANEAARRLALKISQNKFGDFTWYQDIMRKIQDGLKKTLPQDRIKDIEARIEEFKKTFEHMTPEEQRQAYKELGRMELEKFNAQMEMLNTEREAIKKTNDMILDYLDKALQWKPQGVDAIDVNTQEGYKYMTSSFSSIGDISSLIRDNNRQEIDLQKKANDIATSTRDTINNINQKITDISNSKITVVN